MTLKFNFPSWSGLVLLVLLAAGLTGCTSTTTTKYAISCTDAQGKPCADAQGTPIPTSFERTDSHGNWNSVSNSLGEAGTVIGSVPYGATVSFGGEVTNRNAPATAGYILGVVQCATQKCGLPPNSELTPQSCPAVSEHFASCAAEVNSPSYSATCPASCAQDRFPVLILGNDLNVACQCPINAPSCGDTAALKQLNAKGQLAWDTCTPVELPPTTLQAPQNDPLLKAMMGDGACKRVYSLLLHRYVCQ